MIIRASVDTKTTFDANLSPETVLVQCETGFHVITGERHSFIKNEDAVELYKDALRDRTRIAFGEH